MCGTKIQTQYELHLSKRNNFEFSSSCRLVVSSRILPWECTQSVLIGLAQKSSKEKQQKFCFEKKKSFFRSLRLVAKFVLVSFGYFLCWNKGKPI